MATAVYTDNTSPALPKTEGISQQELAVLLANMTQTLLEDVAKLTDISAKEQQLSAEASQDWVSVAKSNFDQTQASEKAYQASLEAQKNPPWWQQLVNVMVKYVLPIVMCAVAGLAFGPAALVITAAVILATTIPVKDGKSLVGLASSAIAQGVASATGMSPAAEEVTEGVINVTFAVVLAVVGGGAASAFAVEAAVETAATEEAETAVGEAVENGSSSNAGKLVGFNSFATVGATGDRAAGRGCWRWSIRSLRAAGESLLKPFAKPSCPPSHQGECSKTRSAITSRKFE
jgi:hypothetical protein